MSGGFCSRVLIASAVMLLALWSTAWGQAPVPRVETLEVVSSGFIGPGEKIEPGRIGRVFSRTPAVNAQAGTGFAMTVRPVGEPKGADVVLRFVWRAPRPGVGDMSTGKYGRRITEQVTVKLGDEVKREYVFKEANDMVLGRWRVEVWSGRRRLAVRRFAIR